MIEYYLTGGTVRLCEVIIYSSLWIVTGCFIAAIFRRMVGAENVKKLFADNTRWGLAAGWGIGMLLPVCSLGVIPIVRELHRAGVKRGTIVAFGLTAPLFNPMSVLYGLTLSDPIAILSFSLCALLIVSCVGFVWERLVSASDEQTVKEQMPAPGIQRSVSVFYTASRELIGPTLVYVAIGIFFSVMLATLVPKGFFHSQLERDNWMAPLTVAAVATPVYSTPLLAMSQIGGMFQHGNSIGAAFTLLIFGAGTNIGLLCWLAVTYGVRPVVSFCLLLSITTIGLAYAVDKPLYPKGVEPIGHSHAFDVYAHPFDSSQSNLVSHMIAKIADFWKSNEYGGTYLLVALIVMGLIFSRSRSTEQWEDWFTESKKIESKLDRNVPEWLLGGVAATGLVVASIVGCYIYYPPVEESLAEMSIYNAKCVFAAKNQEWEAAEKWIGYCDNLSRRLEVGVFLRQGNVGEFQAMKARIYRENLETLKDRIAENETHQVPELSFEVSKAYLRLASAFKAESL